MNDIRLTLKERVSRTASVESFRFVPAQELQFAPGQFLELIFDEKNRTNRDLNKYLSFSCAPGKAFVEVTKRMSQSQFSSRLRALVPGDTVLCRAPLGTCIFKDAYAKIAFLIGGIGITPVISIIEYITLRRLTTDIVLVYSNRTAEDIPFRREIDAWQAGNERIQVAYTVTECDPQAAFCETGQIDHDMISRHIPDWRERVIYIYGTPGMVQAMQNLCLNMSCDRTMVKTEHFKGYE